MNITEKLDNIPSVPGIYLMKDAKGNILYVGKAKSLSSRVRSYFQDLRRLSSRIQQMVLKVTDIDYITTATEVEALILESNLIKKHKPKYNVMLRDDKEYPYLKLSIDEEFPRLLVVRRVKKDKARYFGPYVLVKKARETLRLIYKIFPLRQSKDNLNGGYKRRPCLNYQMGRCLAPCAGYVTKEEYWKIVKEVALFLRGRNDDLIRYLKERMKEASENMRYEEAARIRDQIAAVKSVIEKQRIISTSLEDQDILALHREGDRATLQILFVRGGKMIGDKGFNLRGIEGIEAKEILSSFIKQYYGRDVFIPKEILIMEDIEDLPLLEKWLSEKKGVKVSIFVPKRGKKRDLVIMAAKNAMYSFSIAFDSKRSEDSILEGLKRSLNLSNIPRRIEAFDISNISGTTPVGSMVSFLDGKANKEGYRRFRIRDIEGADDCGMMAEVIRRRYSRLSEKGETMPDLIILDGGKGQLNTGLRVLRELKVKDIDVIGIAKGEDRRDPKTDVIYQPSLKEPILLPLNSHERHLLQRIRDEAHRFAITYHRRLRDTDSLHSIIEDVSGIGKKRMHTLLTHFGSLKSLREASVEEIMRVSHINVKIAKEIKRRI